MNRKGLVLGLVLVGCASVVGCAAPAEEEASATSENALESFAQCKAGQYGAKLRAAPSTNAEIVTSAPANGKVEIYCITKGQFTNGSDDWFGASLQPGYAMRYVHSSVITTCNIEHGPFPNCDELVSPPPAPPEPTPTPEPSPSSETEKYSVTVAAVQNRVNHTVQVGTTSPGKPFTVRGAVTAKDASGRTLGSWACPTATFYGADDYNCWGAWSNAASFDITYFATAPGVLPD